MRPMFRPSRAWVSGSDSTDRAPAVKAPCSAAPARTRASVMLPSPASTAVHAALLLAPALARSAEAADLPRRAVAAIEHVAAAVAGLAALDALRGARLGGARGLGA